MMIFPLFAAPKAVIFDFGNVMASPSPDRMISFLTKTFSLSPAEFKKINEEKKLSALIEEEFWMAFGKKKGIALPEDWPQIYREELRASIGSDEKMYALVDELKRNEIQVGMLSNIWESLAKKIEIHGLYTPFTPCLLSYQIG